MDWLTGGQAGEAKRLVKQLADPAKREQAARDLIQLGEDAVPALIDALGTKDSFACDNASRVLVQIGPRAVLPLCKALTSTYPEIRERAAEVLGAIKDKRATPFLLDALRGEFYMVRTRAALALGQVRDAQAIPLLTNSLMDKEPEVRAAACIGLGKFSDPQTFESIGNVLLDDSQIAVRQAAAKALGETRRAEAVPYLMDALHDSFWWFEREQEINDLLDAISKMDKSVVPELIEALRDPEGTVRKFAALLLSRIPDERAIEPLTLSLYDTHPDVCKASAEALASIGAPALPILLDALHHPEAWIRQQAIIGLTKSRDPQVVPAFIDLLNDESREVRKQIVLSLGELKDSRTLPLLQELAASRADREMATLAKQAIQSIQT